MYHQWKNGWKVSSLPAVVTTPNISTSEIFMSQKLVVTTLMHMCPPFLRTFLFAHLDQTRKVCFWWWHFWSLMSWTSCWGCAWMISNQWISLWHSGLLLGPASHVFFFFFRLKSMDTVKRDLLATHMLFNMMKFITNQKKIWFKNSHIYRLFSCVSFCPPKKNTF